MTAPVETNLEKSKLLRRPLKGIKIDFSDRLVSLLIVSKILVSLTKTAYGGLKTKKAQPTAAPTVSPPLENQWTALRAARQLAAQRRKIEKSFLVVSLYDEARTYFEENV